MVYFIVIISRFPLPSPNYNPVFMLHPFNIIKYMTDTAISDPDFPQIRPFQGPNSVLKVQPEQTKF